jgi:hypothetical protein
MHDGDPRWTKRVTPLDPPSPFVFRLACPSLPLSPPRQHTSRFGSQEGPSGWFTMIQQLVTIIKKKEITP